MFTIRINLALSTLLKEAAAASGLSASKILRNTAKWFASGRIELTELCVNVAMSPDFKNVIKVKTSKTYYNSLGMGEVVTADLQDIVPPKAADFRRAIAAVCIVIIEDAKVRAERQRRLDAIGKEGVDYNVPDYVLELRETYGVAGTPDRG